MSNENIGMLTDFVCNQIKISHNSKKKCFALLREQMQRLLTAQERIPINREELDMIAKDLNNKCTKMIINYILKKYPDQVGSRISNDQHHLNREMDVHGKRQINISDRAQMSNSGNYYKSAPSQSQQPQPQPRPQPQSQPQSQPQPQSHIPEAYSYGYGSYASPFEDNRITDFNDAHLPQFPDRPNRSSTNYDNELSDNRYEAYANMRMNDKSRRDKEDNKMSDYDRYMSERNAAIPGMVRPPTPDFDGTGGRSKNYNQYNSKQNQPKNIVDNNDPNGIGGDEAYEAILGDGAPGYMANNNFDDIPQRQSHSQYDPRQYDQRPCDSRQSQGQYDSRQSQGQYDSRQSQGQYDPRQSQGQYDSRQSQGQYDSRQSQGQYDPRQSQGQYDSRQSQGQYDSRQSQGQYDSRYGEGRHNQSHSQTTSAERESQKKQEMTSNMNTMLEERNRFDEEYGMPRQGPSQGRSNNGGFAFNPNIVYS
jgi:hypothetical protein